MHFLCPESSLVSGMESYNLDYSLFAENVSRGYKDLQSVESLADVTLVCDDGDLRAHRLVLFTGSEFFKSFLPRVKHHDPYIYLKGMKVRYLELALDFMYRGAIQVAQEDITSVLQLAQDLKITGLSEEESQGPENSAAVVERYKREATRVSEKLDSLLRNLSEVKEDTKSAKKQNMEDSLASSTPIKNIMINDDDSALEHMKKGFDEEGKITWNCKLCGYLCNDKSRTKRHVRNNHLKERRKSSYKQDPDTLDEDTNIKKDSINEDEDENNIPVVEIKKRPRTRGMKKEIEKLIEDMETDQIKASESFIEDFLEEDDVTAIEQLKDLEKSDEHGDTFQMVDLDAENEMRRRDDLDEQAVQMMEKDKVGGKVSWVCKVCDFASNDKTRTRRHIKSNHLRKGDKNVPQLPVNESIGNEETLKESTEDVINTEEGVNAEDSFNESDIKSNFDSDDVQALAMMTKFKNDDGKTHWQCVVCDISHFDKTRIRKHVKRNHMQ